MALRVNGARAAIKYQSYRLISRTERDAARRVVPRWVPPREYEERRQPGDTLPQFSHCSSSACTYEINLRVGGRERERERERERDEGRESVAAPLAS
jgi:hypothetical protein